MNDREVKTSEMLNRVVTFGHDNAADFAAESQSAGYFAQVVVVIREVETARTGQQGGRATARAVLLAALRVNLKNIARTADSIAEKIPGFADRFQMPANNAKTELIAAGNRMLEQLQKPGVAEKFLPYEMSATFVADLASALKAIAETKDDENSEDTKGVENTVALKKAIAEGIRIVGHLDSAMHNKYRENPVKLAAWLTSSRIERAPRRGKKAETPATANSEPAATTPAK